MRANGGTALAGWSLIAHAPAQRDRLASAVCVLALHALVGLVLLNGFEVRPPERVQDSVRTYDIPLDEAFPPVEPRRVPKRDAASAESGGRRSSPEGVAALSPSASRAPQRARSRVSPSRPVPVRARTALPKSAELAGASGSASGNAASGGGLGGSGGVGAGTGTGFGSGVAVGARQLGGRLVDADYPRSARLAGAEGTVFVRFAVDPDGRAHGCVVTRSSGHAELDATTCRLIERRFRYDPARDADGRPVADVIVGRQRWWLARRRAVDPLAPETLIPADEAGASER